MENITFSDIIRITNGKASTNESFNVTGIETDSRRIKKGDAYVAIVGERVDGHDFIRSAAENGAVCAIISHDVDNSPIPTVKVTSAEEALRAVAREYFKVISPKTVAVTGSCGKTTTKEMLYCVFSAKYNTLKTNGNYNSTIGLPLTVARLSKENKAAVLEMGTGHKGEIATMTSVVSPDIAVITNIGTCHIEFFGSRDNIAKEKTDLFRAVKKEGTIVINADDEYLIKELCDKTVKAANKITFGIENKADVTAENIKSSSVAEDCKTEFDIVYGGKKAHTVINTLGIHNVYNALAAASAGIADGIDLNDIASSLASFVPDDMRMKVFKAKDGITVISDVYNSNPQAVKASLKVLSEIAPARKIAILGDMLEQGTFSEENHILTGKEAGKTADVVIARGDMAGAVAKGAAEYLSYRNINYVSTNEEVIELLSKTVLMKNDTVLVKGSRGMKMEAIVDYLLNKRFN